MATKKAASTKKTSGSKTQPTKTTVSTVKAVSSTRSVRSRFSLNGDRRTVLAAALIGEFIGTFILTSAFLVTRGEPLYLSFTLIGVVLLVGTLSGAYVNPALTIGAWVTRKLSNLRALSYVLAQVLGAAAGFVLLSTYMNANAPDASSAAALQAQSPEVFKLAALTEKNHWFVFFAELLGAALLAFAFSGALREKTDRVAKAMTYGFAVLAAGLTAGVAATSVKAQGVFNPAVAAAASAVDWTKIDWFAVAVYMVAPVIGGIIGFALRDVVETE